MTHRLALPTADRRARLARRLDGIGPPLLLDGATGTELERRGLGTTLPLWSTAALIEAPQVVRAIHRSHLEAGAEIVTANTFRTQRRTLERAGLGAGDDARLTRLAVTLAREAIDAWTEASLGRDRHARPEAERDRWVAGSLPPLEDCYAPERVPDREACAREHTRQAELLAESGVDLVLVETMNHAEEAAAACRAVAATGLPFVVGCVAWQPNRLLSGHALDATARSMLELGARAVGVNCVPPSILPAQLEVLLPVVGDRAGGLLVSPNLGEPNDDSGFTRAEDHSPAAFADALAPWLAAPALRLVGGCCGTTPDHVQALVRAVPGAR